MIFLEVVRYSIGVSMIYAVKHNNFDLIRYVFFPIKAFASVWTTKNPNKFEFTTIIAEEGRWKLQHCSLKYASGHYFCFCFLLYNSLCCMFYFWILEPRPLLFFICVYNTDIGFYSSYVSELPFFFSCAGFGIISGSTESIIWPYQAPYTTWLKSATCKYGRNPFMKIQV